MRILLVDDDPAATRLYRVMLASAGHEVLVFDSGIDAVEAAERERDVVFLTSEPSPTVEKRARDAGAAAFLRKPCSPDVLSRTIARVCKKRLAAPR